MATGIFTRSFKRTKTLTTFIETYRNVIKSLHLGELNVLITRTNIVKTLAFVVP